MDIVLIVGRVLFALMLVTGGLNHFTKAEAMAGYAAHKGVPQPKLANLVSGLMLLLGGVSIILGVWADLGALLAAAVLLAMAVMMHDFWKADDQAKQMETISFFQTGSRAGGALVMFAALAAADTGVRVIGPMITDGLFPK
ncbi:MAG: DoxX family protein [Actinomycetota bacterium]